MSIASEALSQVRRKEDTFRQANLKILQKVPLLGKLLEDILHIDE